GACERQRAQEPRYLPRPDSRRPCRVPHGEPYRRPDELRRDRTARAARSPPRVPGRAVQQSAQPARRTVQVPYPHEPLGHAEACGLPRSEAGRQLGVRFAEMVGRKREPTVVSEAPVHANVYQGEQADMWMLPGVRHFEMDLGAVFLMGLIARAPGESFYNIT